jgi:hypothetical protein
MKEAEAHGFELARHRVDNKADATTRRRDERTDPDRQRQPFVRKNNHLRTRRQIETWIPTAKDLQRYLSGGIFCDENGRYRYTQTKKADIIVLSRDGKAFGHLNTFHQEPPTTADLEEYPRTKQVYLVSKAVCYGKPVQVWKGVGRSGYSVR